MKKENLKILLLRTIGNILILSGIAGVIFTFGPALKEEVQYRWNRFRGIQYTLVDAIETPPANNQPNEPAETEIITPVDRKFGIVIPKINANARIIANVDAGNYEEYSKALKEGVAHARGTVFPGMKGNVYLFAHSTDNLFNVGRYNAIFYLLKELEKDDEVVLYFENKKYKYTVTEKSIINPDQTDIIFQQNKDIEEVTLQTCYPPGTTWKRLIVKAKRKST